MLASPRLLDADQIQPASLDLRLGAKAYRVRASFMPGPGTPVIDKLERLKLHEIDLTAGAVLETGCVYIVPLLESLALSPELFCFRQSEKLDRRLDIFTRVIADGAQEFDKVPAGYKGPLYLEVSPRTFPLSCAPARACRRSVSARAARSLMKANLRCSIRPKRWSHPKCPIFPVAALRSRSIFPARGQADRLSRQAPHRRRRCGQARSP
ncbi:2'-deoxycytidine 5'-triphosphate deaminase domain-containing protein [Brucella sp. 10RB9215]|uniref:2'-deoxycytidine 5'-triphosphate deaminase domain-containing protein n=1 Tax=Brucella sp. 10RB9215 TaxID=1149953 RepID=UPI00352CDB78